MGVRVFVPRGSELHAVAGSSQEAAWRLRALMTAGGAWVRVRYGEGGGGRDQFANLAAAVVVEILQAEDGVVARVFTHGGALVGEAHWPDAVQAVRDWVAARPDRVEVPQV